VVARNCIVCENEFDARGTAKTCGSYCRQKNKAAIGKAWSESNPEKDAARHHKYRRTNREGINERQRAHRSANREKDAARKKAYCAANPEKEAARQRAYYAVNFDKRRSYREINISSQLWKNAKQRSKKSGLPFNLTPADIVVPSHCPVLGIPLSMGSGHVSAGSPTIDRIIPLVGYVKGNIRIISHRANMLKSDCTDSEDLRKVIDYIEENRRLIDRFFDDGMSHYTTGYTRCRSSQLTLKRDLPAI
jgi:hypothetical protein